MKSTRYTLGVPSTLFNIITLLALTFSFSVEVCAQGATASIGNTAVKPRSILAAKLKKFNAKSNSGNLKAFEVQQRSFLDYKTSKYTDLESMRYFVKDTVNYLLERDAYSTLSTPKGILIIHHEQKQLIFLEGKKQRNGLGKFPIDTLLTLCESIESNKSKEQKEDVFKLVFGKSALEYSRIDIHFKNDWISKITMYYDNPIALETENQPIKWIKPRKEITYSRIDLNEVEFKNTEMQLSYYLVFNETNAVSTSRFSDYQVIVH